MKTLTAIVLLLSSLAAYSQWIPCGPQNLITNSIYTMIAYRDTIYGTNNGIVTYAATADDSSWKMTNDTSFNILSIQGIGGDKIYSKVSNKIMMTSDKGKTWSEPFPELQQNKDIAGIYVNGNVIIALLTSSDLFLSVDSGKTWVILSSDDFPKNCNSMVLSRDGDTILMNSAVNAYTSLNKGKTWKQSVLDETASDKEYKSSLIYKGDLIVWSSEKRLMRSSDGGETWKPDYTISQVKQMYLIDTFMVAMTHNDGLKFYTKQDEKYALVRSSLKGISVIGICKVGNTLTANTEQGCYFSSDLGETWVEKNAGIYPSITNMIKRDSIIYISTVSLASDPFKTKDNGSTWEKLPLDTLAPAFSMFSSLATRDSLIIYSQFYHNYIFVSKDGGKTWKDNYFDTSLQLLRPYSIYLNNDGSVLARAKDGIYISYDTIKTWTRVDSTPMSYSFETIVKSGEALFACSDEGVLRSNDAGLTWSKVDYDFINPKIRGIESDRKYVLAFSYDSLIYLSSDYGSTWRTIKTSFSNIESAANAGDNVFAVSYGKGLYLTKDFGEHWELISGDLSSLYLNNVVVNKDSIIVSSAVTTVYKAALSDFGVYVSAPDGPGVEQENFLWIYYPYPIPARHELKAAIQWDITQDIDKDDISIYNLYGKVAGREDIVIEKESACSGILHWDCSRYEPGVYFIVAKHGSATKMLKAIVE